MAMKKVTKKTGKKAPAKKLVSMAGGWDSPTAPKKRKKKKARTMSGFNTKNLGKNLVSEMIDNGKYSASGFGSAVVSNRISATGKVSADQMSAITYGLTTILGAVLPNKMKVVKTICKGIAISSGERLLNNVGSTMGLTTANAYQETPTMSGFESAEMSGFESAEMSGFESAEMNGSIIESVYDGADYSLNGEDEIFSDIL